jgi:hypothetical protein
VSGGLENVASGLEATELAGNNNTASGDNSTVVGGVANVASGQLSFAAGTDANATNDGSFVWADITEGEEDGTYFLTPFISQGLNTFNVRATGGTFFYTGSDSQGHVTAGVKLLTNSTSWSTVSDRTVKKNFQAVDGGAVLEKLATVPIQKWNYKWESDTDTPNIGPMAQDFKAAFYPGRDDKSISTLEFDGVELAAIQGLNDKLKAKDAEIADLRARLERLERLLPASSSQRAQ